MSEPEKEMLQPRPISRTPGLLSRLASHRYRTPILKSIVLISIWLILSEHYDLLHIGYGLLSVAFVLRINSGMPAAPLASASAEGDGRIRIFRLFIYLFWLLWEIAKSGVYVAYLVVHPKMPIDPMLVRFRSRQPNALAKVILGNSITLTPGTITLDIDEDLFTVHALNAHMERGLVSGDMETRVAKLFLSECEGDMCTDTQVIKSGRGI